MLLPSEFRDLVSGRRRGWRAAIARAGLAFVEVPYTAAVCWRNARYDVGRRSIERVAAPVISVGNLTLGGTGKTPMVAWLARWMRARQVRVAWISRGYGAKAGVQNDEALELEQLLPDVPHLENPDRAAAARMAIDEFESQLLLLDDGFQHRRLARDLDIVLLDALEPFGFGRVFPRGTLREPLTGLRRAQVVALSRADLASEDQRAAIRQRVLKIAPEVDWLELVHAPSGLLAADGRTAELAVLKEKRLAAFCGIGNPAGFRHTLETCDFQIMEFREFPDHYAYQRVDVEELGRRADELNVDAVVCTHKDLVKLGVDRLGSRPLWAVQVGLQILSGQDRLEARLAPLVDGIVQHEKP